MKNAKRHSATTLCQNMLRKHGSFTYGHYIAKSKNKKTKYLEIYGTEQVMAQS